MSSRYLSGRPEPLTGFVEKGDMVMASLAHLSRILRQATCRDSNWRQERSGLIRVNRGFRRSGVLNECLLSLQGPSVDSVAYLQIELFMG